MKNLPSWCASLIYICVFSIVSTLASSDPLDSTTAYKAPFNKQFDKDQAGKILSWIDTGKAVSAVAFHKGLLITPVSFDFGGGLGDGALIAYNVDDPEDPKSVFDSRNYPQIYHNNEDDLNYLGDIGELHTLYFHKDYLYLTDRGKSRNGFFIIDLSPLYDDDPESLPIVVSRYYFPGVEKSTVYDGFSFSPAWVGGRYVYAPTGSTGLFIIDTSDLEKPRLLAHLTKEQLFNQTLRSAHAIGDMLVLTPAAIASTNADLVLLDVSNPAKPNLLNRHRIKVGYQGILYGSLFYNGAFAGNRGTDKFHEIIAYDIADPNNIKTIHLGKTDKLFRTEYIYVQDDDLFIGHYPGLTKWNVKEGKATFKISVEPQFPPVNDYAFVSPLGNLVVITSDHDVQSKLSIGVHSTAKDTTSPKVKYVLPQEGSQNVSIHTKIGISFSEFIGNASLENGAAYLQEKASGEVISSGYSHGMGIVHIVPDKPLKQNTTYDVFITKKLQDIVGNFYADSHRVTTFSTGDKFTEYSVNLALDAPKKVNQIVSYSAKVTSSNKATDFEFSWNFGDGSPDSPYSFRSDIKKQYQQPGNYNVSLSTRRKGTQDAVKHTGVQVIYRNPMAQKSVASSTLALNNDNGTLFTVNPDNDTLTSIDVNTGIKRFEVGTGAKPSAVLIIDDKIWVSCKTDDAIIIHDAKNGNVLNTIKLGYASAPHGMTYKAQNKAVYIALSGPSQVLEVDSEGLKVTKKFTVKGPLRNIAYIPKYDNLVVPQLIADEQKGARVNWIDVSNWKLTKDARLSASLEDDGLAGGRGYPNFLGPIAVNPEQTRLWIPGKKDNLFRGVSRDGKALTFDHTVRSVSVAMDIESQSELEDIRQDLDNSDFASAATFNAQGNVLYVATMGSKTITAIDAYQPNNQSTYSTFGAGSIGLIGNDSGDRLYIHNQLSRSVAVFEATPDGSLKHLDNWDLVSVEKLPEDVLSGKHIFHDSTLSNLSREGYMSCSSCHIDGSHDGRVWDLTNLGEGLRNTIDLRGKEGMKHGILHWTGNFDEVQDFDNQIVALNEGTGYLFDAIKPVHRKYFKSHAGINFELDNLAKYLSSLNEYPRSPHRKDNGDMTDSALQGRKHFIKYNCHSCHSGAVFTDSPYGLLHDVGTANKGTSGKRLGEKITGFDTPSLIGLWQSSPYLHDGSIKSLEDVFSAGEGKNASSHQVVMQLSGDVRQQLFDFLMQIDSDEGVTQNELHQDAQNPQFEKPDYHFVYQYRFDKQQQVIGKVATIQDSDNVSFYIKPSVYAQLFEIDSATGQISFHFKDIYLRNIANMVLSYTRSYPLTIVAKDHSQYAVESTVSVNVDVIFPNIPMDTKDLNKFKRLINKIDSGKKLNKQEQTQLAEFNSRLSI